MRIHVSTPTWFNHIEVAISTVTSAPDHELPSTRGGIDRERSAVKPAAWFSTGLAVYTQRSRD